MTHWKSMFDSERDAGLLFACHLEFRDLTLTIAGVAAGSVTGAGGKSSGKPIVSFSDHPRRLALNATNGKVLQRLFGTADTRQWIGRRITLYPSTTTFGSETVECIRVRETLPDQPPAAAPPFDVRRWLAALDVVASIEELDRLRAELNAAKPPREHRGALAEAIASARERCASEQPE